jgi:hypothetical protein
MPARQSNGLRVFVALLGTVVPLAPGVVSGCGSSGSSASPAPSATTTATTPLDATVPLVMVITSGGGAPTSSSSSSGGNPLGDLPESGSTSSSGGSSDDGSASDGGSTDSGDGSLSESGSTPNYCPDYVAPLCGLINGVLSPCDLRSNTCCVTVALAERCIPGAGAKCNNNEATIHCSQACDCSGGDVCCGVANTLVGAVQTVCQSIPDGGLCNPNPQTNTQASAQFCKTDGECKNGQACIAQTCEFGAMFNICGLQSQDPFACHQ